MINIRILQFDIPAVLVVGLIFEMKMFIFVISNRLSLIPSPSLQSFWKKFSQFKSVNAFNLSHNVRGSFICWWNFHWPRQLAKWRWKNHPEHRTILGGRWKILIIQFRDGDGRRRWCKVRRGEDAVRANEIKRTGADPVKEYQRGWQVFLSV